MTGYDRCTEKSSKISHFQVLHGICDEAFFPGELTLEALHMEFLHNYVTLWKGGGNVLMRSAEHTNILELLGYTLHHSD